MAGVDRRGFLKRLCLPVAALGANYAAQLDPEGEPAYVHEGAIIVNGDHVTLNNLNIRTVAKYGVKVNRSARYGLFTNSILDHEQ